MSIPPEPFSQLVPKTQIAVGDIFRDPNDAADAWREITVTHPGELVPDTTRIYARLVPPEGYAILPGDAAIKVRDVCWRSKEPRWEPIIRDGNDFNVAATVGAFADTRPEETIYVARPDAETPDHLTMPILPHHRELAISETVRRADRMICEGMDVWQTVSERVLGAEVTEQAPETKFVRYCRPISPNAGNWYVDLQSVKSKPNCLGSADDPFASLEEAQDVLESLGRQQKQAIFGIIWEVRGVPLFAYDLPEPPAPRRRDLPLEIRPGVPQTISADEAAELLKEASVDPAGIQSGDNRRSGDMSLTKAAQAALDQLDMEKFRLLGPDEEIRMGDMIHTAVDGAGDVKAWQLADPRLIMNEVGIEALMVRRRAPANQKMLLRSMVDETVKQAEVALVSLRKLQTELHRENADAAE
jgi:hypothetical protein